MNVIYVISTPTAVTLSSCEIVELTLSRFKVKTAKAPRNEHAYAQAKFSPKGVEWVVGLWSQHQIYVTQQSEVTT